MAKMGFNSFLPEFNLAVSDSILKLKPIFRQLIAIQEITCKFVQKREPMTFEEYLISKKISKEKFAKAEPDRFEEWKAQFDQMHPESFTMHKKFFLNPFRRKYHL